MARIRWEYREVVRSVSIVAVEEIEPIPMSADEAGRLRRWGAPQPAAMPRRLARWTRWAGPALGVAALALSREVVERRHRLGAPKPVAVGDGRTVFRALPAGDRSDVAP